MKEYMTHNGYKTLAEMRYELFRASGDVHWCNFVLRAEGEVVQAYAESARANDGSPIGYVMEG